MGEESQGDFYSFCHALLMNVTLQHFTICLVLFVSVRRQGQGKGEEQAGTGERGEGSQGDSSPLHPLLGVRRRRTSPAQQGQRPSSRRGSDKLWSLCRRTWGGPVSQEVSTSRRWPTRPPQACFPLPPSMLEAEGRVRTRLRGPSPRAGGDWA